MILGERTGNGPHIDYIPDALGSVVAAVDQNLNTTFTAAYSPFGDVIASTGTAPNFTWNGTLGYLQSAGRPFAEYSVRARFFSNRTGRWTSTDSYWPDESPYNYAWQSPIARVDPSGHLVWPTNCCSHERPALKQTFVNSFGVGWGRTDITSTLFWSVRKAAAGEASGAVSIRWEEMSNEPPSWYNKPRNRWIDIPPNAAPAFPDLPYDQNKCVKKGCPTGSCNGNSTDTDPPTYLYGIDPTGAPLDHVRCLCFRLTVYSQCKPSASVYTWSQTVAFDFAPLLLVPVVHAPSDPLTDMYCSGQRGTCPQGPRTQ